jgi:gliding motility-associated-like protein
MRLISFAAALAFFVQNPIGLFSQNTFQNIQFANGANIFLDRMASASNGDVFYTSQLAANGGAVRPVLARADAAGNILWSKAWSMSGAGNFTDVCAIPGGGAIATLSSYPSGGGTNSDLVAVDAQGSILWAQRLVAPGWFLSSIHAVQGGFLAIATFQGALDQCALLKIDANGSALWSQRYSNIRIEARNLFEDTNGDLYLAGQADLAVGLLRVSANGDVLHARRIKGENFDLLAIANSCVRTTDDSLVISGYDFDGRTILLKTDRLGNVGSTRVLENPSGNGAFGIGACSDAEGNLLLGILDDGAAPNQALLAKFGPQLEVEWVKEFGQGANNRAIYCIEPCPADGGLWIGGAQTGGSMGNGILIKTDYKGTMFQGCCPQDVALDNEPFITTSEDLQVTGQQGFALSGQTWSNSNVSFGKEILCVAQAIEEIAADTLSICPGACVNFSMNNAQLDHTYAWYFEGGTPDSSMVVNPGEVCYGPLGTYSVILVDEKGCFLDSTSVVVKNSPDKFPNAFAPNGFNKTFKPLIECPVEDYYLQIFNRWGDIIFESFDQNETWDGTINGKPAPVDTYVYRVQYFLQRDGVRIMVYETKKELTLLR